MKIRNRLRWLAACASLLVLGSAQAFIVSLPTRVAEYQNEVTGHYLLLTSDDAALVDRGAAGPGWGRTGYYFETYDDNGAYAYAMKNVCRFYSPANNSHFFTAYAAECDALQPRESGWVFEKYPFRTLIPYPAACPPTQRPVYRLYNNRHAQHDANHRYTADPAVRSAMQAAGWADEGAAFCASSAGVAPETHVDFSMPFGVDWVLSTGECEMRFGGCVGLTQIAPMPTWIRSWLPPSYITRNPAFPWGQIEAVTGLNQSDLFTSLPVGSPFLLQRSFVQPGPPTGVHIVGSERLFGVYAGMSPMQVLAGGTSADRVFPWRGTRDRTLVMNADLSVKTVRRSNEAAHAYGHPMLEFVDQVSGRKFYVTLQAFGTLPAGDYIGKDATTGWAIVSTSFRANPLFGRRLEGEYVQCDPSSATACIPARTPYKFALDRQAFQAVLAHARTVDPALSANVSDFFLASFRSHNETYLDAELGMALHRMWLEIFVAGAP